MSPLVGIQELGDAQAWTDVDPAVFTVSTARCSRRTAGDQPRRLFRDGTAALVAIPSGGRGGVSFFLAGSSAEVPVCDSGRATFYGAEAVWAGFGCPPRLVARTEAGLAAADVSLRPDKVAGACVQLRERWREDRAATPLKAGWKEVAAIVAGRGGDKAAVGGGANASGAPGFLLFSGDDGGNGSVGYGSARGSDASSAGPRLAFFSSAAAEPHLIDIPPMPAVPGGATVLSPAFLATAAAALVLDRRTGALWRLTASQPSGRRPFLQLVCALPRPVSSIATAIAAAPSTNVFFLASADRVQRFSIAEGSFCPCECRGNLRVTDVRKLDGVEASLPLSRPLLRIHILANESPAAPLLLALTFSDGFSVVDGGFPQSAADSLWTSANPGLESADSAVGLDSGSAFGSAALHVPGGSVALFVLAAKSEREAGVRAGAGRAERFLRSYAIWLPGGTGAGGRGAGAGGAISRTSAGAGGRGGGWAGGVSAAGDEDGGGPLSQILPALCVTIFVIFATVFFFTRFSPKPLGGKPLATSAWGQAEGTAGRREGWEKRLGGAAQATGGGRGPLCLSAALVTPAFRRALRREMRRPKLRASPAPAPAAPPAVAEPDAATCALQADPLREVESAVGLLPTNPSPAFSPAAAAAEPGTFAEHALADERVPAAVTPERPAISAQCAGGAESASAVPLIRIKAPSEVHGDLRTPSAHPECF